MTVKYRKGDLQGNTDYMSRIEQVNITREMRYIASINELQPKPPTTHAKPKFCCIHT